MKKILDLGSWPRRDHFHFFKNFNEPFFGVVVEVDVTEAYRQAKDTGASFFIYYLYRSLQAVNATEPFRYRIEGDVVVVYDAVHASSTINRDDGTFDFSWMPYEPTFQAFLPVAQAEIEAIRSRTGLATHLTGRADVIHYSALPWLRFTALSHARHFAYPDSIPKISFGKYEKNSVGRLTMPVSVHAHHALVDGVHVGEFFQTFQRLLDFGY